MKCEHKNCTLTEYSVQATEREVINGVAQSSMGDEPTDQKWFSFECADCGLNRSHIQKDKLPSVVRKYLEESIAKDDAMRW